MSHYHAIGCRITQATMPSAVNAVIERIHTGLGGYVCFANVHVSVLARENPNIRRIINDSFMSLPDGKPIYWVGRLKGIRELSQIPGPDFLPALLAEETDPPLKHYFYGGEPQVVTTLIKRLICRFPKAQIVGFESPPFGDVSVADAGDSMSRIRESRADIVWVGLGAPKQELWMAKNWQALKPAILLGVGAAFAFHTGETKRAPSWMRKLGLEWLHRLSQEPGRLWKRYMYTNTMFVYYILQAILRGDLSTSQNNNS